MVGQEVHTTLKVAIRDEVYMGCAEYPAATHLLLSVTWFCCWCNGATAAGVMVQLLWLVYHCWYVYCEISSGTGFYGSD